MLESFNATAWTEPFSDLNQQRAINQLESGRILFFPELAFAMTDDEKKFLTPEYADPNSKNIGYNAEQNKLWGVKALHDGERVKLKSMLRRFAESSKALVRQLLPHYQQHLILGRTSFRPVQVSNRKTSYRKDDRRLHVDAFPSAPNQGKRILRVFCNINPQADRVWRIGEPFENVARRFAPKIPRPFPGSASLWRLLKITKSRRTPYDHYMLHMHDRMKEDESYQQSVSQQEVRFPPASTWIVQTDHVSHAAMQGQYLLEQTFYLPITAMQNPNLSPLRVLEKILDQKLT
jgi:3-deoxy-D-manno-oct-2-ulosonic acid (Kdo) hydroxylase